MKTRMSMLKEYIMTAESYSSFSGILAMTENCCCCHCCMNTGGSGFPMLKYRSSLEM